jgi:hypothetical protein
MRCLPIVLVCTFACSHEASAALLAAYSTQGLSGGVAQWSGSGGGDTVALPALRGSGLGPGGGINVFSATGVSTGPALNLANNDYVRFGFTLDNLAGAEFAVTSFRATISIPQGLLGMQYQLWGFFADQQPFEITQPASLATTTLIAVNGFPGNAVVFPGQTAEIRVYFWSAPVSVNALSFIGDGNPATPDVEIHGIPIPAPAGALFFATAMLVMTRRRA